jgi:hypothetical protein
MDFGVFLWLLILTLFLAFYAVATFLDHRNHEREYADIKERFSKIEERFKYRKY